MDAFTFLDKSSYKASIVKYAFGSRLIIVCLQLLANLLIPDHEANVFVYPKSQNFSVTSFDNIVHVIFDGFVRWDAQYFIHIALYGYIYENTIAFFPLYPLLIRYISWVVSFVIPILNMESILLLVSLVINCFLFIKAALVLFELTSLFRGMKFAYSVALLFCFNPASIFFSAPYSESLFCYLTFQSMLQSIKLAIKWIHLKRTYLSIYDLIYCIIYTSLSAATRSNGILNVIFFIYIYLRVMADNIFKKQACIYTTIMVSFMILLGITIIMLIPFVLVQLYDYYLFCSNFHHNLPDFLVNFAGNHKLILWGSFLKNNQSWCYRNFPFAYSYVQDHYWNVGFLKYYELKQLPNFCLAAPITYIVLKSVVNYLRRHKNMLLHLGIFRKLFIAYTIMDDEKEQDTTKLLLFDIEFALVIHIIFLTVFCVLCIHIQVTTRMVFSASPIIYWFSYQFVYSGNPKKQLFVKYYYIIYFVLGTIMFCNFLPWT